jgi:hypothetical protein
MIKRTRLFEDNNENQHEFIIIKGKRKMNIRYIIRSYLKFSTIASVL